VFITKFRLRFMSKKQTPCVPSFQLNSVLNPPPLPLLPSHSMWDGWIYVTCIHCSLNEKTLLMERRMISLRFNDIRLRQTGKV
jgi:hypothetical protein